MNTRAVFVMIAFALCCSSCGGGGGGGKSAGAGPAVSLMTTYYTNGQKQSEGLGYLGSGGAIIRHGTWTDWFDTGVVYKTGTFSNGVLTLSKPWTEYNADTSVRFDWTDY